MSDPAEKYRDKVDPCHVAAMQAIEFASMMLAQHHEHFEQFQRARENMDSFGGLLDPTLYRDMIQSRSFAQQEKLIKSALDFIAATEKVYADARGAGR